MVNRDWKANAYKRGAKVQKCPTSTFWKGTPVCVGRSGPLIIQAVFRAMSNSHTTTSPVCEAVATARQRRTHTHTRTIHGIRYDTIRDAILTCARKLTYVSLIYTTRNQQLKSRKKTNQPVKTDMLRSIGNSPRNP